MNIYELNINNFSEIEIESDDVMCFVYLKDGEDMIDDLHLYKKDIIFTDLDGNILSLYETDGYYHIFEKNNSRIYMYKYEHDEIDINGIIIDNKSIDIINDAIKEI